jgi:hypothetical protein
LEQVPILEHKLLESQERLLKSRKMELQALEEKQEK